MNDTAGAKSDTYFPSGDRPKSGVANRAIGKENWSELSSTIEYSRANLPRSGDNSKGPLSFHAGELSSSAVGFPDRPLIPRAKITAQKIINKYVVKKDVFIF